MHELSIAQALVERIVELSGPEQVVRRAVLRAGPMRSIDPLAMDWAWQSASQNTPLEGARLELQVTPWHLRCPDCQRRWESTDLFAACTCGSAWAYPVDSDELALISMDVDLLNQSPANCSQDS